MCPSATSKSSKMEIGNVTFMLISAMIIGVTLVTLLPHYSELRIAKFDFYVMSMSYQPEFCYENRHDDWPGCSHPLDFWKAHLTIHGLWPEYQDGSYPASCSTEVFDNATVAPLESQMLRYWPNVKYDYKTDGNDYLEFWEHEWSKHGTCSGLSQYDYFSHALQMFVHTPPLVGKHYGESVEKDALVKAFGGGVILRCAGGKFLSEVRVCLSMDKQGVPLERITCPEVLTEESNCPDMVYLAKFESDHF
jgi:ribonuclease T2